MRRKTIAQLLLVAAICVASSSAMAQRRRGRGHPRQTPHTTETAQPAAGAGDSGGGSDSGSMTFTSDETASTAPADNASPAPGSEASGAPAGDAGGGGGLEGIGGADVRAQRHTLHESIYAVQQIYALRNHRLEFQPSVAASLNDPYVSHTGVGVAANFWVSNVLAVGLNFMWFQGLNGQSELGFHVARSAHLVVPINEYQMEAALNFTYVPIYGKFLMFNRYIFHWDIYVLAGVGFMRTRPIPVVDPEVRTFNYDFRLMFNAAIGVRVFINRWLGIVGELRNYVYPELLEAVTIAGVDRPVGMGQMALPRSRQDNGMCTGCSASTQTWTGGTSLTDNVMVQFGITVYLPFGVTYHLLK